jgi:hypothetical protein
MRRLLIAAASVALLGLAAAPAAHARPHLRHRFVSETSSGKHVPRRSMRLAKGKAECPFCSGVRKP